MRHKVTASKDGDGRENDDGESSDDAGDSFGGKRNKKSKTKDQKQKIKHKTSKTQITLVFTTTHELSEIPPLEQSFLYQKLPIF